MSYKDLYSLGLLPRRPLVSGSRGMVTGAGLRASARWAMPSLLATFQKVRKRIWISSHMLSLRA